MKKNKGHDNLIGNRFNEISKEEAFRRQSLGGKNSGITRRKQAEFKQQITMMMNGKISDREFRTKLEEMGMEDTVENAMHLAMVKEALSGNVKAYETLAKYSGQILKDEADMREQTARIKMLEAKIAQMSGNDTEAIDKLDDILESVKDNAIKQETE